MFTSFHFFTFPSFTLIQNLHHLNITTFLLFLFYLQYSSSSTLKHPSILSHFSITFFPFNIISLPKGLKYLIFSYSIHPFLSSFLHPSSPPLPLTPFHNSIVASLLKTLFMLTAFALLHTRYRSSLHSLLTAFASYSVLASLVNILSPLTSFPSLLFLSYPPLFLTLPRSTLLAHFVRFLLSTRFARKDSLIAHCVRFLPSFLPSLSQVHQSTPFFPFLLLSPFLSLLYHLDPPFFFLLFPLLSSPPFSTPSPLFPTPFHPSLFHSSSTPFSLTHPSPLLLHSLSFPPFLSFYSFLYTSRVTTIHVHRPIIQLLSLIHTLPIILHPRISSVNRKVQCQCRA